MSTSAPPTPPTRTAPTGGSSRFELQPDGTYTFTLIDQIDHHPVNLADHVEGLLTLDLSSVVRFTDGDGDFVTLAADNFTIVVQDDVSALSIEASGVSVTVDETPGIQSGPLPPASLYFAARGRVDGNGDIVEPPDGDQIGRELFRVKPDGTVEFVANIAQGATGNAPGQNGNPSDFIEFDGALYFATRGNGAQDDDNRGPELWKVTLDVNGDPQVSLVQDIRPGPTGSDPRDFIIFNNALYFVANGPGGAGGTGTELYRIVAGNPLPEVLDINPGNNDSNPRGFVIFDGSLWFSAIGGPGVGREVFRVKSDGTFELVEVDAGSGGSDPQGFTEFNGALYFSANNGTGDGTELFRIVVGPGDTAVVEPIPGINPGSAGSNPENFFVFNDALYFKAQSGGGIFGNVNDELFRVVVDGSNNPTVELVADINTGTGASNPQQFVEFNGDLYFVADQGAGAGNGLQLYRLTVDGTNAVTSVTQILINPNGDAASQPQINQDRAFAYVEFNGALYFVADGGTGIGLEALSRHGRQSDHRRAGR
ncbi:MAG: hypothetical protein M5U07_12450 [Xanthobacteraceae bacterium]|nr:hypothetical protein [Xanthobacteraceae bacterium]